MEDKKETKPNPVGRPRGEETATVSVRVLKKHKEFIKPLVNEFVKTIKLPE